jgi:RNA polymerase sigma-54 factor
VSRDLRLGMQRELRQLPVPLLVQLMRLVPLTVTDVRADVERALADNPFLTTRQGERCPGCGRHVRGRRCPSCAALGRRVASTPEAPALDWRSELEIGAAAELPGVLRAVVSLIVQHLDDSGLLGSDEHDVASSIDVPVDVVDQIVAALRRAGPPGIAARSPLHCVQLQAAALVSAGAASPIVAEVAEAHLHVVATGDLDAVAAAIGCDRADVADALDVLRRSTRPWAVDSGPSVAYVEPDLVIRYVDRSHGSLVAEATDAAWFGLRVEAVPAGGERWAAAHVHAAREMVRQLDMRAGLLRGIGDQLIAHQRGFLTDGAAMHRPLRRAEVATALGVHPSTVGRAVHEKVIRCPDGRTVPLASCFGVSTGPVEALRGLLEAHPAATDRQLVELLAGIDVRVARRTVAKYRALLGVEARGRSSLPR